METLENQPCPTCNEEELTLLEDEIDLKDKGIAHILGMKCHTCDLERGDVELDKPAAVKQEFVLSSLDGLKVQVARGGSATIALKELKLTIKADIDTKGYVGVVGDLVQEFINFIKADKDQEEDKKRRKKLMQIIDDLLDVQEGKKTVTVQMSDPTGNSVFVA